VPATISIGNAAAVEGGGAYRFTDNFVAPDAYGLAASRDLCIGPADGNVYVASHDTDVVKVFEGGTGRFLRDLGTPGGELDGPWAMTFGADGLLYVSGRYSHNVVRFDTTTGASEVFVTAASGGIGLPWGITFGPGGDLYASSRVEGTPTTTDSVKRYSGATGAYLGDFVTAGSGGLNNANGLTFGSDGNLYVASFNSREVKRYNGQTGAFIDNFVAAGSGGISEPSRLLFRPDGYLYVENQSSPAIYRYGATSGAFVDVFVSSTASGGFAFDSSGELYFSQGTATLSPGSSVGRFAPTSFAAFTVTLDAASESPVSVSFSTADGTATAGADFVATSGTIAFAPGETARTVLVQALDDTLSEPTETFTVNLSNPTGATISQGQAVGTILDDDTTKFFVVDDGGADRTYRYGLPGTPLGNSTLTSGDTAPRGAASNAAGTTLWVADANKNVYVYNAVGMLQGSWAAGGLPKNATVEGIATIGADIWIVANSTSKDKVFKYSGAASRLSGSQSAASSFGLASGDTNPKGIVTDGTSLWIVDDGSSTDKVFKYTLTGNPLGSWTIDPTNSHPTGLTINPNNVSDIWIVDNGTDKVYQYTAAAGRTSGSQSAAATFALAAGNTNPQDIADPPAISIGDATATEGGAVYQFTDVFVAPDGYGLAASRDIRFGPDGNVYVASHDNDVVKVFEGGTGRFLRDLSTPGGELDGPWALSFGSDGRLYVSGRYSHNIVRFDINSGAYDVFVGTGTGGLSLPWGIAFGPDGNLYATSVIEGSPGTTSTVKRYNGATGAYLGDFVTAGSGGLDNANGVSFGPDGNLYVVSFNSHEVKRYDGQTGAFIGNFVTAGSGGIAQPNRLLFRSDGYLYLEDQSTPKIYRYSATTGAFVDVFASLPMGIQGGSGFAFAPAGEFFVSQGAGTGHPGSYVSRFAPTSFAAFALHLEGSSTSAVSVNFATANGTAVSGSDYVAASGTVTFAPGETTRTILVRTLDDSISEPAETFFVNLSNPVGATTVADAHAVGTIIDNEPLQVASATVNGGAAQRSRVTDITVAFTGIGSLPANRADAFRLTRIGPDGSPANVTLAVDLSASTATQTIARLTFSGGLTEFGSLVDGLYRLTILAAEVSGGGQPLDGDANGSPGGDFTLDLHRLYGDVNGDKTVNITDLTAFRNAFGATATDANYQPFLDLNGDGVINITDLTQFRNRFGVILP
jgi:WD40 repeat protein